MILKVTDYEAGELNRRIKDAVGDLTLQNCCGQRFLATGLKNKTVTFHGTPGNALGAYLDGASLIVHGNTQDAVGDTMNDGSIIIHGNAGDALGYAMRGGGIYVLGDVGYRTGIHMKEYRGKKPVIVVGGRAGSFLGEYLAGGVIIVLGIGCEDLPVGRFTGTGMHGGKIFLRAKEIPSGLPEQVLAAPVGEDDLSELEEHVKLFAAHFEMDAKELLASRFFVLRPNVKNPYKRLYAAN